MMCGTFAGGQPRRIVSFVHELPPAIAVCMALAQGVCFHVTCTAHAAKVKEHDVLETVSRRDEVQCTDAAVARKYRVRLFQLLSLTIHLDRKFSLGRAI